jgi:hypothetical protein
VFYFSSSVSSSPFSYFHFFLLLSFLRGVFKRSPRLSAAILGSVTLHPKARSISLPNAMLRFQRRCLFSSSSVSFSTLVISFHFDLFPLLITQDDTTCLSLRCVVLTVPLYYHNFLDSIFSSRMKSNFYSSHELGQDFKPNRTSSTQLNHTYKVRKETLIDSRCMLIRLML